MLAFALVLLVIVGIGGLLAIPLDVSVSYESETAAPPRAEFVWLFGLLRRTVHAGKGKDRAAKRPRGPRRSLPWRRLRELWDEGLSERVAALLRSLRGAIAVRELCARVRVGTGDPAETGRLMGVLFPLRAALVFAFPAADVSIEPDFLGERSDADVHGGVRIVPLTALPPILRFALAPITLRTAWAVHKETG